MAAYMKRLTRAENFTAVIVWMTRPSSCSYDKFGPTLRLFLATRRSHLTLVRLGPVAKSFSIEKRAARTLQGSITGFDGRSRPGMATTGDTPALGACNGTYTLPIRMTDPELPAWRGIWWLSCTAPGSLAAGRV